MLSTDEGYQRRMEPFVGNFTANIAASKLAQTERSVHNDSSIQAPRAQRVGGWGFDKIRRLNCPLKFKLCQAVPSAHGLLGALTYVVYVPLDNGLECFCWMRLGKYPG
jgi:hypothetical protein